MTRLDFVKMEGAGNDYVFVDGTRSPLSESEAEVLAAPLSDRHFGVGSDGLILLAPSERADCRMIMWNADGSRGAMCGNGLRCLAKLAHDTGIVDRTDVAVETDSGVFPVRLIADEEGEIVSARVPMVGAMIDVEPESIELGGRVWQFHRGSVGNPHAVVFVDDDPERLRLGELGAAFQDADAFVDGVNVEFVRVVGPSALRQRTFERGSGETLACGSGATVAALAAVRTERCTGPSVHVHVRGGELLVHVTDAGAVELEGPVRAVFTGVIDV